MWGDSLYPSWQALATSATLSLHEPAALRQPQREATRRCFPARGSAPFSKGRVSLRVAGDARKLLRQSALDLRRMALAASDSTDVGAVYPELAGDPAVKPTSGLDVAIYTSQRVLGTLVSHLFLGWLGLGRRCAGRARTRLDGNRLVWGSRERCGVAPAMTTSRLRGAS